MSYFQAPNMAKDPDMKKIYNYIQMLNQQLRYCFSNIDPEDNFSLDAMVKYQETDDMIAQLEVSMNGFISDFRDLAANVESSIRVLDGQISLKVSVDELCSEISATTDTITFQTGYVIFNTNNFKLDATGNAEFSGAITGGSININDRFVVTSNGGVTMASSTFSEEVHCNGLLYTDHMRVGGDADVSGYLSCDNLSADGSVSCEILYERSDRRLKEDIIPISDRDALEAVLGLEPVSYRFAADGTRSMGFLAQDVIRMQVEKGIDLPMTEQIGEYLAIPYTHYGALFAGAIREQARQIRELEEELER